MGIKQRRERERHELRQGILDAARAIAAQEGWTAVTMRRIAEQIEYSPPTIYEYFASKEAILQEVAQQGFVAQMQLFVTSFDDQRNPEEQILAMARLYWDFAQDTPELYQVMYDLSSTSCDVDEAKAIFLVFGQALQRWAIWKDVQIANLEDAAEIMWAQMHGLVSLSLSGRLINAKKRGPWLISEGISTILSAWSLKKSD